MEIQERLTLSFAAGGFVQIPASLVRVCQHGLKFLKLQLTPCYLQILVWEGDRNVLSLQNPSFGGSQKLATFEREGAGFLEKSLAGKEEEDLLFEDAGVNAGSAGKQRNGLPKLDNAPETAIVDLCMVWVWKYWLQVLGRLKMFVKLDSTMHDTACTALQFLHPDCQDRLSNSSKRSYQKKWSLQMQG